MAEKRSLVWHVDLLLFSVFLILYIILGAYISQVKHYLPGDSISRLVSAWLVWSGAETKLATIGFVWPPIPTLALLPFTWIEPLVHSWMALVIVSAFFMAISVPLVGKVLDLCGVNNPWRWILTILYGLNPLSITFGINGMSEAIVVAACLAAFYALLRFWDSNRNMHLIMAAFFFSLLPLIRYEFALLSAAAGGLLLLHCWRQHEAQSANAFRDFLEGRLLAFSSLAIYPLFLWSMASWMIMGNPFYFLVNDRSAASLATMGMSGQVVIPSIWPSVWTIIWAWFLSFPVGLLAVLVLLFLSWQKRSLKYMAFALVTLIIPLVQFIMLLQRTSVPLLRYFMTNIAFGFILIAILLGALRKEYRLNGSRFHWISALIVLAVLASNFATAYALRNYTYQDVERQTWKALTTSEIDENVDITDALKVGETLSSLIPPGSRVLIDTYRYGFGVMLGANNPKIFLDFTDPNYDKAVLNPVPYVDYVLVPSLVDRGGLYLINRAHPKLHDEGAAWATLVDGLPETNGQWRLYKVKR